MKLKRMISILLVLCMVLPLTACMSAGTNPTETQTVPTTTIPVTTTTAPLPTTNVPGPKTLNLSDYKTGIDNSYINEDTLVTVLKEAEAILQEYERIIIPMNKYLQHGFPLNLTNLTGDLKLPDSVSYLPTYATSCLNLTDVIIDTDIPISSDEHESIRFYVFCALLLQEYAYCTWNDILDSGIPITSNVYHGDITIAPQFRDFNYETVGDFVASEERLTQSRKLYTIFVREGIWWAPYNRFVIFTIYGSENEYDIVYKKAFPDE